MADKAEQGTCNTTRTGRRTDGSAGRYVQTNTGRHKKNSNPGSRQDRIPGVIKGQEVNYNSHLQLPREAEPKVVRAKAFRPW